MKLMRRAAAAAIIGLTAIVAPSTAGAQEPPAIPAFANTACPHLTDSVVRLYSAYFLRAPDEPGFDGWVELYQGPDWTLDRISGFFATSDEFVARYGSVSNAEFVDLIYRNLFNRVPDAGGRAFWIGELDSGNRDRGTVMLNFSESEEYILLTRSFTPLAGFFNSYPTGTTFQCGVGPARVNIGTGTRYLDIGFVNPNDTGAQYVVRSVQSGQLVDEITATVLPRDTDSYFNLVANRTSALDLSIPDNVAWMIVVSDTPLPEERGGWIVAPALQGLASLD